MQWQIDPAHSQIQFSVRHLGISTVRGVFGQFTGTIDEDNGAITGAAVDIDVASIDTHNPQRDLHLASADFFDAATHPKAHFQLERFSAKDGQVQAEGALTIRGVTRSITLSGEQSGPIKDPWGNEKVAASLSGKISRKDWGLTHNVVLEAGGLLLSDEVQLSLEVQAAPVAVAA